MFNSLSATVRTLLRHTVLALALTGAAGLASAQTYHVDIDTSAWSGAGFLDLGFNGYGDSPFATATVTNFSGALDSYAEVEGDVTGALPGTVTLLNTPGYNDVFQSVTLGGTLSFNVTFGGSFTSVSSLSGSTFAVGLMNADGNVYLGADAFLVQFELLSDSAVSVAGVTPVVLGGIASVSAVPEASTWLLMLSGVALVAVSARRRGKGVPAPAVLTVAA